MTRAQVIAFVALALFACSDPGEASRAPSALFEDPTQAAPPVVVEESARVALLPQASQDVLRRARLPLLLPRDPALLASAVVTAGPHFSALSAQGEGWSLSISGTDHRHELAEELPPPPPADQVRGLAAIVSENEGIRTVSWDEAQMAWSLEVECFDAEHDPRCTGEDFARALAESLELVGGGP